MKLVPLITFYTTQTHLYLRAVHCQNQKLNIYCQICAEFISTASLQCSCRSHGEKEAQTEELNSAAHNRFYPKPV